MRVVTEFPLDFKTALLKSMAMWIVTQPLHSLMQNSRLKHSTWQRFDTTASILNKMEME